MNRLAIYNVSMRAKEIRKAKGLTQVELAHMAGVEQATVSRFEKGNEGVTLGVVKKIAAALDVPMADLFANDRSDHEQALIEAFRRLPDERQLGWVDMARSLVNGHPESA